MGQPRTGAGGAEVPPNDEQVLDLFTSDSRATPYDVPSAHSV